MTNQVNRVTYRKILFSLLHADIQYPEWLWCAGQKDAFSYLELFKCCHSDFVGHAHCNPETSRSLIYQFLISLLFIYTNVPPPTPTHACGRCFFDLKRRHLNHFSSFEYSCAPAFHPAQYYSHVVAEAPVRFTLMWVLLFGVSFAVVGKIIGTWKYEMCSVICIFNHLLFSLLCKYKFEKENKADWNLSWTNIMLSTEAFCNILVKFLIHMYAMCWPSVWVYTPSHSIISDLILASYQALNKRV